MKPEFLHKESRNWLLLFLPISLIMTWITFALIQPAIEERDPSLYIVAGITYVMLGCLWIGAYEIPVFTGAKCANGYLIIAKSSIIPYYMYIRLDDIKRISTHKTKLESADRHHPTSFVPVELTQLCIHTDKRTYKLNRLPIDQSEKKRFSSYIWSKKSLDHSLGSERKEIMLRIAWIPLLMRIVVLLVLLLLYYPWHTYAWYLW